MTWECIITSGEIIKEAEKHFEKACLKYSPPPYVWRMYAHSLKNQNKSEEAVRVLEEAARRFPDDLVTKSLLDRFKKEGEKGDEN